jgi:hypothetical protein
MSHAETVLPHGLESLLLRFAEESESLLTAVCDAEGRVTWSNPGFARAVHLTRAELMGRPVATFLSGSTGREFRTFLAGEDRTWAREPFGFVDVHGHPFSVRGMMERKPSGLFLVGHRPEEQDRSLAEHLQGLNNELATLAREHARQEREHRAAAERLREALEELNRSYWHLKKIQEVVPVCMSCSRVKMDGAKWQGVADYLRQNEIFMSHGYCPDCADTVLREYENRR